MVTWKRNPIKFKNRCADLALTTWAEFPELIAENTNFKGYIFRGHSRKSFKLESTFLREFQNRFRTAPNDADLILQERRFRLAIRGRISLSDREFASGFEL